MAQTPKVLFQSAPAATTLASVYTVPAATRVVLSTVVVCNRGSAQTSWRFKIAVANAADDPKQYLYYDLPILGNDTFAFTFGLTLSATDQVYVYAGNANLTFQGFGTEVT